MFLIVSDFAFYFFIQLKETMLLTRSFLFIQVVENGNPIEKKNWFPDIEPLFKLLSYENVPPYLKVWWLYHYVLTGRLEI